MGVTIDTRQLDKRLEKMERKFGKEGLRVIAETATREMERVTRAAFAGKYDPASGRPWPARKGSQSWPMLERTGQLAEALGFRSKTLKWVSFAKTTIRKLPVERPSGKVQTYSNLAHVIFHGRGDMPARPFFFKKRSKPPASFSARVLKEAKRIAHEAARG